MLRYSEPRLPPGLWEPGAGEGGRVSPLGRRSGLLGSGLRSRAASVSMATRSAPAHGLCASSAALPPAASRSVPKGEGFFPKSGSFHSLVPPERELRSVPAMGP